MIDKAILHVLDFHTGLCVVSEQELDLAQQEVYAYLEQRLQKLPADPTGRQGCFYKDSRLGAAAARYFQGALSFAEISGQIAHAVYDALASCEETATADVVVADFRDERQTRYLAILLLEAQIAYTHQISRVDGEMCTQLIRHRAILPNKLQKIRSYALIREDNLQLSLADKKRSCEGREIRILPERVLQCTVQLSSKETVRTVTKLIAAVAAEHGADSVEVSAKTKQYIAENAAQCDSFAPREAGAAVFADTPALQEEFSRQCRERQLPDSVPVSSTWAQKVGNVHTIKTDTGIEITFPSAYIEHSEFIHFSTQEDGSLSIELKHIGAITNK